ncbi:MAG: sensor domain-containing diguanylate cyclase [Thermoleophilaceae bacterium]
MGASGGRVTTEHPRPLSPEGRALRLLPFAVPAVLAFVTIGLPPAGDWSGYGLAAGAALFGLVVASIVLVPWGWLPAWAQAGPPLAYVLVVAVLRHAEGGATSGFYVLFLLPVFWLALYGTRAELVAAITLIAAALIVPLASVGAPDYPVWEWRHAALWIVVAPVVGFTVQRLVGEVRERAAVLGAVSDVSGELADAADPRSSICRAAARVSSADVAVLFEPEGKDRLTSTAMFGVDGPQLSFRSGQEPSGAVVAFTSGSPFFVADAPGHPALSSRFVGITEARSALYHPVRRRGEAIGVLALVWRTRVARASPRTTEAIGLLASEAAVAIERADLLARLDGLAHTDELTGLPNRRAWNEELPRASARAERDGRPLSIAMLDLDSFKSFNDAHGHQDGDRLLKEAAAAWRAELREGDVLARYGGEEFAVALHHCALGEARDIVERMRSATPGGVTCSAGVASSDGSEDPADLVARADRALYEAKAAGRDRTVAGR